MKMSRYTTQLRWIVEQELDNSLLPHTQSNWPKVYAKLGLAKEDNILGLSPYPIFDELYRQTLNDKIIKHFYFREIALETAAQFAFFLNDKMNIIMQLYNQWYKSQDLVTDPLSSWDKQTDETYSRQTSSTANTKSKTEGTGTSSDDSRNVFEDTPMGMLRNEGSPNVENLDYATNVTYDKSSGTSTTSNDSTSDAARSGKDDWSRGKSETGRSESQSKLLEEYRSTFTNIDDKILQELEPLFLQIW